MRRKSRLGSDGRGARRGMSTRSMRRRIAPFGALAALALAVAAVVPAMAGPVLPERRRDARDIYLNKS